MLCNYNRGLRSGTQKLCFGEAGTVYAVSLIITEMNKWALYPIYKGGRLVQARIGGIPPDIKAEWVISAVLANAEDPFNILTINQNETLNLWGFSLNVRVQLTDKDRKTLPDEITLLDGRNLNVFVRGRMSVCNECRIWGHVKKN